MKVSWNELDADIAQFWDEAVVPALHEYISVPALSPHFDPDWHQRGALRSVADSAALFVQSSELVGAAVEVIEAPGRTPLVLVEIAPFGDGDHASAPTVLLYGHLDKQPEMAGWRPGFGPWTPRLEAEGGRSRLYGRGGADDCYAVYSVVSIVRALQRCGGSHGRLVELIETSEESASVDLDHYVDQLADRIGIPELVICLDSSAADLERMWITRSLRGVINARLTVRTLTEAVHSGSGSGVAPNPIRVARALLSRIEDPDTGTVMIPSASTAIPDSVQSGADLLAATVGAPQLPFASGVGPETAEPRTQWLRRIYGPALSVVSADGIPSLAAGGNVTLPEVTLGLSLRIPPGAEPDRVATDLIDLLTDAPPHGAQVAVQIVETASGWAAPVTAEWLAEACAWASTEVFGEPAATYGEGGTIPFMAMLGEKFPAAQFVVTGVLVPGSNAHGPNEFLDIGYALDLSRTIARIVDAHRRRV